MGSGASSTSYGSQPMATNTGLANAFLNNGPLPQTYAPMNSLPTTTSPTFAQLSAPGSLPGLTGSLIGSSSMPPLPQPSGPMPIPLPPATTAAAPTRPVNRDLYYSGQNVNRSGMTNTGVKAITNGKPTPGVQAFRPNSYGR